MYMTLWSPRALLEATAGLAQLLLELFSLVLLVQDSLLMHRRRSVRIGWGHNLQSKGNNTIQMSQAVLKPNATQPP
jgi:hypothetical protein